MIIDSIARCFQEGCGISLPEALASARYAEILQEEHELAERFPATTDEGIALRAGLLRMGTLLNTLPEEQAIAQAKMDESTKDHTQSAEIRALVRLLGESIVAAADRCLPDEIQEFEQDWLAGDADQQIAVAGKIFNMFIGDRQKTGPEGLTWQSAQRDIKRDFELNVWQDDKILPAAYGKWDGRNISNCQGKTQMLLAFAKRVGSRAYSVETIASASMVKDTWRSIVERTIWENIKERKMEHIDAAFLESLQAGAMLRSFQTAKDNCFHVGIALQVRDGRWVLIDAHGLAWGVMTPEFRMPENDRVLRKYASVLPGLSLQAEDQVTPTRIFSEKLRTVRMLLKRSADLEEILRKEEGFLSAFTAYKNFGEPEFVANEEGLWERLGTGSEIDPSILELTAMSLFFGPAVDSPGLMFDPDFLAKRIGGVTSYHHCKCIDFFRDQVTFDGRLLHPEIEISPAEHNVAMGMINSLSISDNSPDRHEFFMANSFGQLAFYNALSEGYPSTPWGPRTQPAVAQAASVALRSMRLMHSMCRRRLMMQGETI